MSAEQNKRLVERLFREVIAGKNPGAMEQLISPEFVHHGVPDEKPGVAGFKESLNAFQSAFPDLEVHVEQILAEDNGVATRGYITGTNKGSFMGMPASDKQVRFDYMDWWQFADGRAIENWVQMDIPGIMTQLGVPNR